jgi:hypothetical protein
MAWNEEQDWKEYLSRDAQQILAELLESAKDHKGAYMQAEDVKVAQLWATLIEMKKEMNIMQEILVKATAPWQAIVEVGEVEKRRAIERIVRDIIRPTEPEQEEATRKLVESLMKF